ncbi:endoribonuclease L-PSP [Mariannaea sp. PMI_226]|nr:endoribonuclease L-PSP [Mariannaea sp. PMI_226]
MSLDRVAVQTNGAPAPRPGVYSQGIVVNGLVYTSGVTGKDPATGKMVDGPIENRTHRCIQSLGAILEAAGSSLEHVVEVSLFLTNMDDFDRVNAIYKTYWGELKPTRTCVGVRSLPGNTDIEIKCIGVVAPK